MKTDWKTLLKLLTLWIFRATFTSPNPQAIWYSFALRCWLWVQTSVDCKSLMALLRNTVRLHIVRSGFSDWAGRIQLVWNSCCTYCWHEWKAKCLFRKSLMQTLPFCAASSSGCPGFLSQVNLTAPPWGWCWSLAVGCRMRAASRSGLRG